MVLVVLIAFLATNSVLFLLLLLSALTNFNCGVSTPLTPPLASHQWDREGGGFGLGGGGLSLKEHCGGDHLTVFPASKVDFYGMRDISISGDFHS